MKNSVSKYNWNKVIGKINNSKNILLTTHINPDGDGLGCEAAMYYFLKNLGKSPVIYNSSSLPTEYYFLNRDGIFNKYEESFKDSIFQSVNLIIVFDIGTPERLGCIGKHMQNYSIPTICIDHHPNKHGYFQIEVVDANAASVTLMIYDLIKKVNPSIIDYKIAEALYVGLLTDTGSFRFENTTIEAMEMATEMMRYGVKPGKIYRLIYENLRPIQAKLLGYVLLNLHYELNGKIAWFDLTIEEIKKQGAKLEDVDGFTDFVRSIKNVEVSIMFLEIEKNKIKVNFRSKGKVVVNEIAHAYNGGGHPYAAGMTLQTSMKEAINLVIDETTKLFKKYGV